MFVMSRRACLGIGLIALLIGLVPAAYARQEPPPVVQDALAALSAQVGTTLTISDVTSWTWEQRNFPDTSLGCPRQDMTYAQIATNGYIVTFVYNGALYDYRVSANRQVLFLCTPSGGAPGGTPAPNAQVTPIPVPTVVPTASPTAAPIQSTGSVVCPGSLPTRLAVGMTARSIATGSINIRSATTLNDPQSVIGLLLPGGRFDVIGGPQCADARTWWRISYNSSVGNTTGWIIEGDNVDYWLEPIGGAPTGAPNLQPIMAANAAQLRSMSQAALPQVLTWAAFMPPPSPDAFLSINQTPTYYVGSTPPQPLNVAIGHPNQTIVNMATGPKDAQSAHVATLEQHTDNSGGMLLYISDLTPGTPAPVISERFGFQLPFDANDLAFSADGRWLAVVSGSVMGGGTPNGVWIWDATTGTQVTTVQVNSAAYGVAFSPDNRLMAISAPSEGTYLWDTATWSQIVLLPGDPALAGSSALAFSPDSRLLAVGTQANGLQVWDVTTQAQTKTLAPSIAGAGAFVAFTPDGSVLAMGVAHFQNPTRQSSIYLWDVATGAQIAFMQDYSDTLAGLTFRGDSLIALGQHTWWTWGVY
jgi:hypothetical protein